MNPSAHYTVPYKAVLSIFIVIGGFAIIGEWNRYVFAESNLPFLFLVLLFFVIILGCYHIPKGLAFPPITFTMVLFVLYMIINIDNEHFQSYAKFVIEDKFLDNGFLVIIYQLIFWGLFSLSALLYYQKGKFSFTLWLLICGYIFAFIARNSIPSEWAALKDGYNLSCGLTVFTLAPFVYFFNFDFKKYNLIKHIFFFFFTIWLFMVSSRGATLSMAVFYGCYVVWPYITKNQILYYFTFFSPLIFLTITILGYIWAMTSGGGLETINEISMAVFEKRIGTRFEIWDELISIMQHHPQYSSLFGFGTEIASRAFVGSEQYVFRYTHAPYLSAHSLYFELVLRFGAVGTILFFSIFLFIWKTFWSGRKELAVRVAGSFLIASFFFSSTSVYWIFNMPLRCGFGWIILGIGAGACLREKHKSRINTVIARRKSEAGLSY